MLHRVVPVAVIVLALSSQGLAQAPGQARLEGLIHHYTADLDGSGPWQIVGDWSLIYNNASGRVDFSAVLSMVRSDNEVRGAHSHNVELTDGQVAPIAGGYRITGNAAITSNGSLAGFSGSPIEIDITGGAAVVFANLTLAFGGGATSHFGTEPLRGVVK